MILNCKINFQKKMVEGPPGWIDPHEVKDLVEDGSIVIGPGGKHLSILKYTLGP